MGGGLLVFASVLADESFDRVPVASSSSRAPGEPPLTAEYRYGWAFLAAAGALCLAELAAVMAITAYLRRFPSVEDMVIFFL